MTLEGFACFNLTASNRHGHGIRALRVIDQASIHSACWEICRAKMNGSWPWPCPTQVPSSFRVIALCTRAQMVTVTVAGTLAISFPAIKRKMKNSMVIWKTRMNTNQKSILFINQFFMFWGPPTDDDFFAVASATTWRRPVSHSATVIQIHAYIIAYTILFLGTAFTF